MKAGRAFFRFNYYISKTPIPLEKVGWGMFFSAPIPIPPAAAGLGGIEAGTCLLHARQVTMTQYHLDVRETVVEVDDQPEHRILLGCRSGVAMQPLASSPPS